MSIEVRALSKTFGSFTALKRVDLMIPDGKLVALLGPSGSGKTTLLRVIAGLEQPDAGRGEVLFDGKDLARRSLSDRGVGFVFQHYALFRHMTVAENVAFGLRVRPRHLRPGKPEIHRRVHDLLELVQMEGLAQRYPHQLSGGQRQRVALARALAIEPRVLLLDEPFGALDAKVRQDLRGWLRRLHDELHVTSVFVTHDQDEALEVADSIVVMNHGVIEQVGTPEVVLHEPRTEFVMSFLGTANRFHGRVQGGLVSFGSVTLPPTGRPAPADGSAHVFVRPHEFDIAREPSGRPSLEARVRRVRQAGAIVRIEVDARSGGTLQVEVSREMCSTLDLQPGASIFLVPRNVRVFPRTETN